MAKANKASKKIKARARPMGPGYQIKPEDVVRAPDVLLSQSTAVLRLRPQEPRVTAPKVNGGTRLTRSEVWEKLETAMKTLRALPDKERRFFVVKSGYPDFVRDYMDAYSSVDSIAPKFQPSPQDISEYLEVLAWTRHLHRREWQILWWRSFGMSYGVIAKYIGRSDEAARKRFENALTDVWSAAVGR